jgi:hypothetical protein
MYKRHAARIERIEEQLRQNKLIVAKRNNLFHNVHLNLSDPVWVGRLINQLFLFALSEFDATRKNKPGLVDYLILYQLRDKMTFTLFDVEDALKNVPKELFIGNSQLYSPNARAKYLKQLGLARSFLLSGKRLTFVVTPQGKIYLLRIMEIFRTLLLTTLNTKATLVKGRRRR